MTPNPNSELTSDLLFMGAALEQAKAAAAAGEVPVGAVVVHEGVIIAAAGNAPVTSNDPTAHAEIRALRMAAERLGNYRLQECELFVTLEPCAMCAGALMQARLKRVVYAMPEPKTGAAGSVLDLFAMPALNHHTRVEHGLLANECREALQSFFKQRRQQHVLVRSKEGLALRQDALRTPDARFATWPSDPLASQYWHEFSGLDGLRMHGLCFDASDSKSKATVLCLHGPLDWSLAWQTDLLAGTLRGHRVICPDLIGFGRSDKPKREAQHTLTWHVAILHALIEHLGLEQVSLLTHPDMMLLARRLAASNGHVLRVESWPMPEMDSLAQAAPFPDRGHSAGPRAFKKLLSRHLAESKVTF